MSRPYQFTPDQARSPLDRQPPNPFPAGQPPSFKTNVNRAKTKRWVEAKSYSYDGDDWGDADEYDEYGGYDGPSVQQPTGLRQPGQGVGSVNEGERNYMDPASSASVGHHRTTSYDRGDEYRDFSSGSHMSPSGQSQINNMDGSSNTRFNPTMTSPGGMAPVAGVPPNQQYYPSGPPLHVQTNAPTYHQPPGGYGDLSSGTRQSSATSWGQSPLAESTSNLDPQQRRDFTPSAMPQPLHTYAPQGLPGAGSSTGGSFPPRKSSPSQSSPTSPFASASAGAPPSEPTSATTGERRPSNPAKALPFIRPADIYKRIEEERQRERQSMDSSRPSIDSLTRPTEEVGASATSPRQRVSSDSLGPSGGGRSSSDSTREGADSSRLQKPALETVPEKKSEYNLPGFSVANPILARILGAKHVDSPSSPTRSAEPSSEEPPMQSAAVPASQPPSGIPTFPEDHRPPWEAAERPAEAGAQPSSVETPRASAAGEQPRLDIPQMSSQSEQPVSPVQHQSSWGFRSAVDRAFERNDDVSVPPTPVSSGISPPESDVSRSNTTSTSGISPILSRAPSGATAAMRAGDAPAPAVHDGSNQFQIPRQRPGSTDSTATLQNLQQIPRKTPPGHSRNVSNESYRRNLGTPSSGNSPARSPAIKAQTQLPEPEVAQLETVSPTDFTTREADIAAVVNNSADNEAPIAAQATKDAPAAFLEHRKNTSDADLNPVPRSGSPASRSGSPGKGRVRDLAEKFDADTRRNSTHSIESRRSVVSWTGSTPAGSRSNSPVKEEASSKPLPSERPAADRVLSFRPKLPGGWESFATTTGTMTPTDALEDPRTRQESPVPSTLRQSTVPDTQTPTRAPPLEEDDSEPDFTPTTKKRSVAPAGLPDPLTDPLGAAAYAGSAMAEALKASMGLGEDTEAEERKEEARRHEEPRKNRSVGDVFLRPLALDRKASSIASSSAPPTPPPKDDSVFDNRERGTYGGLSSAAPLDRQDAGFSAQEAPSFSTARPPLTSELSTDTSMDDLESDRLRKEIEQSLNDPRSSVPGYAEPEPTMSSHLAPETQEPAKRESSILPSEYDSYWASRNSYQPEQPRLSAETPRPGAELQSEPQMQQETGRAPETAVTEAASAKTAFNTRPDLLNQRFSWENSQTDLSRQPSVNAPVSELSTDTSNDTPRAGSPLLQVIDEDPKLQQFDGVRGAYAGTAETGPSYQQQSVLANPQVAEQHLSRELPAGAAATLGMPQPSQAAHSAEMPSRRSQEGLHVVNAESGEIPQLPSPEVHKPARESMIGPAELPAELAQQRQEQPLPPLPAQQAPHSPTQQDRIPPFREILQIKSAPDRIATYNRTRQQFAEMHTGLTDWTTATLTARPEYADVASAASQRRPSISATTPAGSMRHRHRAPSLSLPTLSTLPIFGNKSNAGAAPQPQQQHQPVTAGPSDPVYEGQGSSPGGASVNREKMQAKGKELFHTAGLLSGKATVGAKGLFAKGKSRFRGSGGVEKAPDTRASSTSIASSQPPSSASSSQAPPSSLSSRPSAYSQPSNTSQPPSASMPDPSPATVAVYSVSVPTPTFPLPNTTTTRALFDPETDPLPTLMAFHPASEEKERAEAAPSFSSYEPVDPGSRSRSKSLAGPSDTTAASFAATDDASTDPPNDSRLIKKRSSSMPRMPDLPFQLAGAGHILSAYAPSGGQRPRSRARSDVNSEAATAGPLERVKSRGMLPQPAGGVPHADRPATRDAEASSNAGGKEKVADEALPDPRFFPSLRRGSAAGALPGPSSSQPDIRQPATISNMQYQPRTGAAHSTVSLPAHRLPTWLSREPGPRAGDTLVLRAMKDSDAEAEAEAEAELAAAHSNADGNSNGQTAAGGFDFIPPGAGASHTAPFSQQQQSAPSSGPIAAAVGPEGPAASATPPPVPSADNKAHRKSAGRLMSFSSSKSSLVSHRYEDMRPRTPPVFVDHKVGGTSTLAVAGEAAAAGAAPAVLNADGEMPRDDDAVEGAVPQRALTKREGQLLALLGDERRRTLQKPAGSDADSGEPLESAAQDIVPEDEDNNDVVNNFPRRAMTKREAQLLKLLGEERRKTVEGSADAGIIGEVPEPGDEVQVGGETAAGTSLHSWNQDDEIREVENNFPQRAMTKREAQLLSLLGDERRRTLQQQQPDDPQEESSKSASLRTTQTNEQLVGAEKTAPQRALTKREGQLLQLLRNERRMTLQEPSSDGALESGSKAPAGHTADGELYNAGSMPRSQNAEVMPEQGFASEGVAAIPQHNNEEVVAASADSPILAKRESQLLGFLAQEHRKRHTAHTFDPADTALVSDQRESAVLQRSEEARRSEERQHTAAELEGPVAEHLQEESAAAMVDQPEEDAIRRDNSVSVRRESNLLAFLADEQRKREGPQTAVASPVEHPQEDLDAIQPTPSVATSQTRVDSESHQARESPLGLRRESNLLAFLADEQKRRDEAQRASPVQSGSYAGHQPGPLGSSMSAASEEGMGDFRGGMEQAVQDERQTTLSALMANDLDSQRPLEARAPQLEGPAVSYHQMESTESLGSGTTGEDSLAISRRPSRVMALMWADSSRDRLAPSPSEPGSRPGTSSAVRALEENPTTNAQTTSQPEGSLHGQSIRGGEDQSSAAAGSEAPKTYLDYRESQLLGFLAAERAHQHDQPTEDAGRSANDRPRTADDGHLSINGSRPSDVSTRIGSHAAPDSIDRGFDDFEDNERGRQQWPQSGTQPLPVKQASVQHTDSGTRQRGETMDADDDRPMSYLPVARDASGIAQEHIDFNRPQGPAVAATAEQYTDQPSSGQQHHTGALYSQDPRAYGRQPDIYGARPQEGVNQNRYSRQVDPAIDPRQHSSEYSLPGVGPPSTSSIPDERRSKRGSILKSMSRKESPSASTSVLTERMDPRLVAPEPQRGFSYTTDCGGSEDGNSTHDDKSRRRSGIFSGFRARSIGADSRKSRDSPNGTSDALPKERTELQHPPSLVPAGGVPPTQLVAAYEEEKAKKLQRSSTSSAPETHKKKRFSGLASLFGRSKHRSTSPKPNKLSKSASSAHPRHQERLREGQSHTPSRSSTVHSSAYIGASSRFESATVVGPHPAPQNIPPIPSSMHMGALPTTQSNPMPEREQGQGTPPGGYYAPPRFSHSPGTSGYSAIEQQAMVARRVSSPSLSSIGTNQHGRRTSSIPSEPRYDTPPVPGAYRSGSSEYISPVQGPQGQWGPGRRRSSQDALSPQISNQSQQRVTAFDLLSSPHGSPPAQSQQRQGSNGYPYRQQTRMGSITEATHQERPWNISLPEGATPTEEERAVMNAEMWERARSAPLLQQQQQRYQPENVKLQNLDQYPQQSQGFQRQFMPSQHPPVQFYRPEGYARPGPTQPQQYGTQPYPAPHAITPPIVGPSPSNQQHARPALQDHQHQSATSNYDDDDEEDLYAPPRSSGAEQQARNGTRGTHSSQPSTDDALVMRGVSYPGQEWQPRWDGED